MPSRRGPDFSARVSWEGTNDNTSWANVGWVLTAGNANPTAAQVNLLAGSMYANYALNFMPHLNNNSQLLRCRISFFPSDPDLVVFGEHIETTAGGVTSATDLDAGAAVCVSWSSNVYWRGGKPRTYLAALPSSALGSASTFTPAFVSSISAAAQAFHDGVNSTTTGGFVSVTHGFVSFTKEKALRDPPIFFPIVGRIVGTRVDHQRRRVGREIL